MDMPRRREAPPEVQALAELRSAKEGLERDNAELKVHTVRLEQRIRSLQVAVSVLLAITLGLVVGLTISMTGGTVQAALGSGTGVFFAVIMTSVAVLSYIRH